MTGIKMHLHKEHPDLPDNYNVTIDYINGKQEILEVAKHIIVDKIYMFDDQGVVKGWEPHTVPYIEFQLTNDTHRVVASANASFTYDKNWTKIVEIRKQLRDEAAKKSELNS